MVNEHEHVHILLITYLVPHVHRNLFVYKKYQEKERIGPTSKATHHTLRHIGQPGWRAPYQGGGRRALLVGATTSVASHVINPCDTSRSPSNASKLMSV
jgi:hypothetical protein